MEHHGTSWQTSPPAVTLPPSPPITPPGNYLDLSPTSSAPSSAPASAFPSPSLLAPASFGALPPPPPLLRRSSSDLFEAVERHRHFSEHHARHIFIQILAAVCDLARTGIIHRDLKDENITLAEDTLQVSLRRSLDRHNYRSVDANLPTLLSICAGQACRFWFVRPVQPARTPSGPGWPCVVQLSPSSLASHAKSDHRLLLLAGRFYGTWTYAAPEVFTGEAYAMFPAEIWSLGVLLHVLLTGENPFPSAADARAGRRMRSKGNVRLGEEASDLIDRCLTVESERRITLAGLASHPWISGHSNRRAGAPSY